MATVKNKVGLKYGKLTAVSIARVDKESWWSCDCDCGTKGVVVRGSQLENGRTKSCGCLRKELCANRQWRGVGTLSGSHWNRIIKCAKQRGIEVLITMEDAWKKFEDQKGLCSLTGESIVLSRHTSINKERRIKETTASLDRIDSSKPYSIDNIQWVHKKIQGMKMKISQEEFIEFCRKVTKFQESK